MIFLHFLYNAFFSSWPPLCHSSANMTSEDLNVHISVELFSYSFLSSCKYNRNLDLTVLQNFSIVKILDFSTLSVPIILNNVHLSQSSNRFCLSASLPHLFPHPRGPWKLLIIFLIVVIRSSLSILLSSPIFQRPLISGNFLKAYNFPTCL